MNREQQAYDRWLTTEPERVCEWCGQPEECADDCGCPECESQRALDEDANQER